MSDPSQQSSRSGTGLAPSTPMTVEAMGHALQGLMQVMNVMVTTVNSLTTNVNLATNVRPRATKVEVSKPKPWNRKGRSMEARHFLAAFYNYTQNEGETLNDWDTVTLSWDQNDDKWIAAVLNLMEDEARMSRSHPWWVLHGAGLCLSSIRVGLSPRCITGLVSQSGGLAYSFRIVVLCLADRHGLHLMHEVVLVRCCVI